MNNRKLHPILSLARLFRTSGKSKTLEEALKARADSDAYYMAGLMPRI